MLNKKYFVFALMFVKYKMVMIIKIIAVLSAMKYKKLKINNILIERKKDMLKNPDLEQIYYSRISVGIYKIGYKSLRILK